MRSNSQILLTSFAIFGLIGAISVMLFQPSPESSKPEPKSHPQLRPDRANPKASTSTSQRKKQVNKIPAVNKMPAKLHEALLPFTDKALSNERIVRFKSREDYLNFLENARKQGLIVVSTIDRFNAVRVRFSDYSELDNLIDSENEALNYIINIPQPPKEGTIQDGAVGFGRNLKNWLGISGDNSSWGNGVKVAVIDSGMVNHPALATGIKNINLSTSTGEGDSMGHGTAVASLIAGNHPLTPGVAPSAEILSIQVTDDQGESSSFTIAQAIITAVDNGAQIINISMGSPGASELMRDAVNYAQQKGVVIVASSGNEGVGRASFPAGFDGVISVGAVDANSSHMDFSNQSNDLSITAPGFQVNAAWTEDRAIQFTGTSASAPIVSGAIAATMSQNPGMSATEAAKLVLSYSNEAGAPGNDSSYGSGVLDIGRIMNRNTPGILDAAIASHTIIPAGDQPYDQIQLTVQNRGTTELINQPVLFGVAGSQQQLNIPYLKPGDIYTYKLPINFGPLQYGNSVQVSSSTGAGDSKPSNNNKVDIFEPTPDPVNGF